MAYRYNWHSAIIKSFVSKPHDLLMGEASRQIFNLTDIAAAAGNGILALTREQSDKMQSLALVSEVIYGTLPALTILYDFVHPRRLRRPSVPGAHQ